MLNLNKEIIHFLIAYCCFSILCLFPQGANGLEEKNEPHTALSKLNNLANMSKEETAVIENLEHDFHTIFSGGKKNMSESEKKAFDEKLHKEINETKGIYEKHIGPLIQNIKSKISGVFTSSKESKKIEASKLTDEEKEYISPKEIKAIEPSIPLPPRNINNRIPEITNNNNISTSKVGPPAHTPNSGKVEVIEEGNMNIHQNIRNRANNAKENKEKITEVEGSAAIIDDVQPYPNIVHHVRQPQPVSSQLSEERTDERTNITNQNHKIIFYLLFVLSICGLIVIAILFLYLKYGMNLFKWDRLSSKSKSNRINTKSDEMEYILPID